MGICDFDRDRALLLHIDVQLSLRDVTSSIEEWSPVMYVGGEGKLREMHLRPQRHRKRGTWCTTKLANLLRRLVRGRHLPFTTHIQTPSTWSLRTVLKALCIKIPRPSTDEEQRNSPSAQAPAHPSHRESCFSPHRPSLPLASHEPRATISWLHAHLAQFQISI
jgi:hypothetical protein